MKWSGNESEVEMDSYGRIALQKLKTMCPDEWVQTYGAPLCHHYEAHEEAVAAADLGVKAAAEQIRRGEGIADQIMGALGRFKHRTGWRFTSQKRLQPTRERWAAAIELADLCLSACALFSGQLEGMPPLEKGHGAWTGDGTKYAGFLRQRGSWKVGTKPPTAEDVLPIIRNIAEFTKELRAELRQTKPPLQSDDLEFLRHRTDPVTPVTVEEFLQREDEIRQEKSQTAEVEKWMQTLESRHKKGSEDL